jgi:uncharacterized protein (DUF697 family)
MDKEKVLESASKSLKKAISLAVGNDADAISEFVDTIRTNNSHLSNDDLAKKIVRKKTWFAGMAGGVYGAGGFLTIAPDLLTMWRIQGQLILSIAHIYGHNLSSSERRDEILLVIGISSGVEAANKIAVEAGKEGFKKALLKPIIKEIVKKLPNKIITIAGRKSLLTVAKLVPLIGIPINFTMDFTSTNAVGKAAIEYYS